MQEQPSVTRFLMLGALETLINQALELEDRTSKRLETLHNTVVRLRCEAPSFSLYFLVCDDGIEILESYEGHIDVRIHCSLGALLQWVLTAGASLDEHDIQISGDDETVFLLAQAFQQFDLWSTLRRWIDQYVKLDELVSILRREDPRWLKNIEAITTDISGLSNEIGRQRLLQEEILDELKALRSGLRRERYFDMVSLSIGFALLFAALASANGQLPVLISNIQQNTQTFFFASLGLALVLTRMVFGHRHS